MNIYLDQNMDSNTCICAICHECNDNEMYEIPECKHKFHTSCLLTWFRTGNINCPYCNSVPSDNNIESSYYESVTNTNDKYKIILNYCKRKNANQKIVQKVNNINKQNSKLKEIENEIKELKNEVGQFKELNKKCSKLYSKKWTIKKLIRCKKRQLVNMVNIIPFVINK